MIHPVRYEVDARRERVYEILSDGSRRRVKITPDELERQMKWALEHKADYTPDLDKPTVARTIEPR